MESESILNVERNQVSRRFPTLCPPSVFKDQASGCAVREDVRAIMKQRHDNLSHPHTPETKRRIAAASRIRAAVQKRDHRGRFVR